MTVYVDNSRIRSKQGRFGFSVWSNLTATTQAELHQFAKDLGMKRNLFVNKGHGCWMYHVTDSMRSNAIEAGAVQVDIDQFRKVWLRDNREGRTPEDIATCTCEFHKD